MYAGKYGDVIGPETQFLVCAQYDLPGLGSVKPIIALYFPPYIKPRNFATRQCERQWLTPPNPKSYPLNLNPEF